MSIDAGVRGRGAQPGRGSASAGAPEEKDLWVEGETMRINMGPQHPSTHGVLRIQLELDGETILSARPVTGYLHTGIEKNAEALNWIQAVTVVTRADYLSPFFNETAYCLAVEKLAGIEAPARAQWIRTMLMELNRISSHLVWLATTGLELGAISVATYGFREREMILDIFEAVTGLRMNHQYVRPGGVVMDLPAEAPGMIRELIARLPGRVQEYRDLVEENPIWVARQRGIGVVTPELAVSLGLTGPLLRSAGVDHDIRKKQPYLAYGQMDFEVPIGTHGDCYDRYLIRLAEIGQSLRIVEQCLDGLPPGPVRAPGKLSPPDRERINVSMEALIHHFKLYTEGPHIPEGEVYVPVESPRGELGYFVASDGRGRPWRVHIHGPSFVNLQALEHITAGHLVADIVAILASIDPVMGDVDR